MPEDNENIPTVIISEPIGSQSSGGSSAPRYLFELVVGGRMYPHVFDPEKKALKIGRSSENDIQVLVRTVSRLHANLKYNPAGRECLLSDSGSANGTYINGKRLEKNVYEPLRNGDRVRFGGAELCFRENQE